MEYIYFIRSAYTMCNCVCYSQLKLTILKISKSSPHASFLYNCSLNFSCSEDERCVGLIHTHAGLIHMLHRNRILLVIFNDIFNLVLNKLFIAY